MSTKLKTEIDTPTMGKRVLAAWKVSIEGTGLRKHRVYFEHGQWWAFGEDIDGDEHSYSVVDATGGQSVDGFDFEET